MNFGWWKLESMEVWKHGRVEVEHHLIIICTTIYTFPVLCAVQLTLSAIGLLGLAAYLTSMAALISSTPTQAHHWFHSLTAMIRNASSVTPIFKSS